MNSGLATDTSGEAASRPRDGAGIGAFLDEFCPRKVIKAGRVTIDASAHQVYCGEEEVPLAPKEYQLLIFFVRNPRRAISLEEIREQVWRTPRPVSSKAVSITVSRLRKKLNWHDELKVVRKVGYRLDLDPQRQ